MSHNVIILAVVKEPIFSKITSKYNSDAFRSAKNLIENSLPNETSKNKKDLLPNYQLFINECKAVIDSLPCMTAAECNYSTKDLPEHSSLNSTKPTSAKSEKLSAKSAVPV